MRKRVYYVRSLRPGFRGNYPVGGLVYCFKGTRLEVRHHRSTVFFRRCEPFGRLHRTNHHRSLVFSDGVGHRCRRFFAELVSFGLGYMKTLSSQVRLKNPCFLDNYKNPCKPVFKINPCFWQPDPHDTAVKFFQPSTVIFDIEGLSRMIRVHG